MIKDTSIKGIRIAAGFRPINAVRVVLDCSDDVARTKQAFAAECDINNIVAKFSETGQLPHTRGEPQYGEAPDLDFKESLDLVFAARQEFNDLPDTVQSVFDSEMDYYAFLDNPDDFFTVQSDENVSTQSGENSSGDSASQEPSET